MPRCRLDLIRLELHQLVDLDIPRAGNVPLARVARLAERPVEFLRRAHVDDRNVPQPRRELVDGDLGHRALTSSTSAAIDGRRSSSVSHPAIRSGNPTPSMSRARITHGT